MKYLLLFFLSFFIFSSLVAQENYGKTLNVGLGIGGYSGYYRYTGQSMPVINFNYEISVAKNFTLAPSISFFTYSNKYYYGNKNTPYRYYSYTETVVPIGLKGSYYFDSFLDASPNWDFYLAASIGFAYRSERWEDGYLGDKNIYPVGSRTFFDVHIGTEYHFTQKLGGFVDFSNGVSSIGLAFHGIPSKSNK